MRTGKAEVITLNNGNEMPIMGMGIHGLAAGDEMNNAVLSAVKNGYRHFDNAADYHNEADFGKAFKIALAETGMKREQFFITTKLRTSKQKYEDALEEFEIQRKALDLDYVDLYLIHFPVPKYGLYTEAWKALEHLYKEGVVKSIGVSNFNIEHLQTIFDMMEIKPVVNQFECNPYLSQAPLRAFCHENEIWPEAYFPLGGPKVVEHFEGCEIKYLLDDPALAPIAAKYGKTVPQIVLRWEVQSKIIVIPKSANSARQAQNIGIFDFALSEEDMAAIDALNYDRRIVPDPAVFDILF